MAKRDNRAMKLPTGEMKVTLTNAERQRRWRTKNGNRSINCTLDIQSAAAMLYIKKQWGLVTDAQTVFVALRFLAVHTRLHPEMKQLKLDII